MSLEGLTASSLRFIELLLDYSSAAVFRCVNTRVRDPKPIMQMANLQAIMLGDLASCLETV